MRRSLVSPVLATLFSVACSSPGSDLADDLQADLNAASAKIELVSSMPAQPMRFVSELEQGKDAEDVERKQSPRRVAAAPTGLDSDEQQAAAPESQAEVLAASEPEPAPEAPEAVAEVSAVPSVAPRPAALPVDYPSEGGGRGSSVGVYGDGSGRGGGIGIGDVIGVVIRGGGVGPDHCPPRRGRGRRPGIGGVILPSAPIPVIIR